MEDFLSTMNGKFFLWKDLISLWREKFFLIKRVFVLWREKYCFIRRLFVLFKVFAEDKLFFAEDNKVLHEQKNAAAVRHNSGRETTMTEILEPAFRFGADEPSKEAWRKVTFGEVARCLTETETNPQAKGLNRVVGLEHIDPEDLRVKRWAAIEDGTSFSRVFRAGQVLFGKRRAYQRKVALADFDGICSGDILVFEARTDVLLPELLPFLAQTEGFFQHALGTSAGSLSPRTKWSEMANYEFLLPPMEEQRRIADILWAAEEAIKAYDLSLEQATKTLSVILIDVFPPQTAESEYPYKRLDQISMVDRGKFAHRPRNLPHFYGGKYPFVQTGDVAAIQGELKNYTQTLSEEGKSISRSFPTGAILITIAAVIGQTAITTFETWCPDSVVGIVPHNQMNVRYLEYFLRTKQTELDQKSATQTAQKNINLTVLRPLMVPVPPKAIQDTIAAQIRKAESGIESIKEHISTLVSLRKSLSSELFHF